MQDLRAWFAAFFWVKLNGADIFLFENGDKVCSVTAGSHSFWAVIDRGVRMREIEVGIPVDTIEQPRLAFHEQAVPAHMWQLDCMRKRPHSRGQQLQAA